MVLVSSRMNQIKSFEVELIKNIISFVSYLYVLVSNYEKGIKRKCSILYSN